mmetsp:Transcript_37643/g.94374  ORF Transcript_37643/g.94374 Transcript_37643/m.94374 type:complete len:518 (-) Transcript_37643:436-1989(-)
MGCGSSSQPREGKAHPARNPTEEGNGGMLYDCFLTHDWGEDELGRNNHERVARINEELKKQGLVTWFDGERMQGSIVDQMSSGIDSSHTVVAFVTQRYVQKVAQTGNPRDNCKLEFNYATSRKPGMIVPVVMERRMKNTADWTGAVGMHLGPLIYQSFLDDGDARGAARMIGDEVRRLKAEARGAAAVPAGGGNAAVDAGKEDIIVFEDGEVEDALNWEVMPSQTPNSQAALLLSSLPNATNNHASDLRECVGLTDAFEFGELVKNPLKAMRQEWMTHGNENDKANFDYVVRGAVDPSDYPEHVRESLRTGVYHGGTLLEGEFETGHEGMDLKDFVNHPSSRKAGLKDYHVAAMRLYTSSSYPLYNQPMREGVNPHPIKITMYCLAEGLKMLRKVAAKTDPESYAKTMYLWRGMKDREMDVEAFKARGGTELAPMSTTSSREVAFSYAGVGSGAQKSLLLRYKTKALSRGVLIDYLSMYPKEKVPTPHPSPLIVYPKQRVPNSKPLPPNMFFVPKEA